MSELTQTEELTYTGPGTWTLDPPPKPSEWQCYLIGGPDRPGRGNVIFSPEGGTEPNRFHRFMHWLAFGFKWVRHAKPR